MHGLRQCNLSLGALDATPRRPGAKTHGALVHCDAIYLHRVDFIVLLETDDFVKTGSGQT